MVAVTSRVHGVEHKCTPLDIGASFMTLDYLIDSHRQCRGAIYDARIIVGMCILGCRAPLMAPGLTQIVLLIAVTHILFHKTQAVSNTLRCIFSVV